MRTRYPGKSGRLKDVQQQVINFFESKGFSISVEKKDFETFMSVKTAAGRDRILSVSFASDSEGSLVVAFERLTGSAALVNSGIPPLLGGGFLSLRRLRISEAMERLEKEFWEMIDRFLASS
jgi:hypothetical protein